MRPLPTFTTAAADVPAGDAGLVDDEQTFLAVALGLLGLGALGFTARRRPARDHA